MMIGVGLLFYPLNEARMKTIQAELQEKHAKAAAAPLS
jgi:Na+/melibiose symporter-like transporter